MNMRGNIVLALTLLLPPLGSCADDAYVVVSVLTDSGSVDGVAQFRVHVSAGTSKKILYYPDQPSANLHLDSSHPVTFSVQFSSPLSGLATFEVEPLSNTRDSLGYYGRNTTAIANANISVLVGLVCDPYAPAASCGANQTCALVFCSDPPAIGWCAAAGLGIPGAACASNSDCEPGSQCFTFSAQSVGCAVRTCLRFCDNDDATCGEQGAYCNIPIPCGSSGSFLTCSRPCDPTGTGSVGCAAGLSCFVYGNETTDCACAGLGDLGAACSQNSGCDTEPGCLGGCRPGLSCIVPIGADAGTSGTCRQACALAPAAPVCPTGTTCHPFDGATRLVYGFCQ